MKQNHILCASVLAVLIAGGCGSSQSKIEYIGAEQAKQLAVKTAGLTTADTSSLTADLNSRNGTDYYQIEFTAEGECYRYDIDALTGAIIDSQVPSVTTAETEADTVISRETDVFSPPDRSSSDSGAANSSRSEKASGSGTADNSRNEKISVETAKSKALTHAGLTEDQVTFVKADPETEDGREVYDIEFYTANFTEYDYDVDAYSGEILSHDWDAEDYTAPAPADGSTITEEKAKELALAQVPGASAKDIREFETDSEDGHTEYEGKIIYNGMEYEFEIDAYSGAFRSWEAEPVD